jgi:hypothetical protein
VPLTLEANTLDGGSIEPPRCAERRVCEHCISLDIDSEKTLIQFEASSIVTKSPIRRAVVPAIHDVCAFTQRPAFMQPASISTWMRSLQQVMSFNERQNT